MPGSRSKLAAYALLGWPPHAAGYVAVPLAVSRLGRRHGWRRGRPGPLNLLGGGFLGAGAGLIGWAMASHYRESSERVQVTAKPDYLVTGGAYGVSRNPLYVGGAAMWTGWAVLLGSLPVVGGGSALFTFLALVGIPIEERMLADRFGDTYRTYCERVPRWLGPRR